MERNNNINNKVKKIIKNVAYKKGTPFYFYDLQKILENIRNIKKDFHSLKNVKFFYSLKANFNLQLIDLFHKEIDGIETSSDFEFLLAYEKKIPIVHNAIGNNSARLIRKICSYSKYINFDNKQTFLQFLDMCDKFPNIGFRVNFEENLNLKTNFVLSGNKSKLGMNIDELNESVKIAKDVGIKSIGLMHMEASNVLEPSIIVFYAEKINKLADEIERDFGLCVDYIDLGGGFGFDYQTGNCLNLSEVADLLKRKRICEKRSIIFEPGRFIIANAGYLVLKVLVKKQRGGLNFLITDGGENLFLRKAWFNINHNVDWLRFSSTFSEKDEKKVRTIITGPNMDHKDIIYEGVMPEDLKEGDVIILNDVGAYGSVRMSNFGGNPFCCEYVLSNEGVFKIREVQTYKKFVSQFIKEKITC